MEWTEHRAVAHALGEASGSAYMNSLEGLLKARLRGFRVFEVDLEFTSDGVLVAAHGWPAGILSEREFRREGEALRSTRLSFEELARVIAAWPDTYLILDTKGNPFEVWAEAERHAHDIIPDSTDRLVPQLYSLSRRSVVASAAFPNVLLTLYRTRAPDWFVLHFLRHSGIRVLVAPPSRLSRSFLRDLDRIGVKAYAHTINDRDTALTLIGRGVHGVYSDSVCCFPVVP